MIDDHPTLARVCVLLVTLISEIRGLRAETLAGRSRAAPRTLSDADRAILAELLPAVAQLFGDGEFRVGLLMRRAAERSSVAKRAKRAIAGMNALQVGRLLKRAAEAETSIGGLYVHVIRRSRMGAVICVDEKTAETRMASIFAAKMREKLPL